MEIMLLIPEILSSKNRTQYQRTKFLCERFNTTVLLKKNNIPEELKKKANKVYVFPFPWFMFFLFGFWCLFQAIKKKEKPLIYTTFHPYNLLSGAFLKFFGFKWIVDIWDHPNLSLEASSNRNFLKKNSLIILMKFMIFMIKKTLKFADLLILALLPESLEKYDINKNKLLLVTNGVDLENTLFTRVKKDSNFNVLYLGFVTNIRGVDTLLESISLIKNDIPEIKLNLVGPFEKNWILGYIEKLNIENNVNVTGEVEHKKALEYISLADVCIFTFPHKKELEYIYPIKIFEYMSLGKPIVATGLKGVRSIIMDGKNGLLVEPDNPKDMGEKIKILYKNKSLRDYLEKNALKDSNKYSWNFINKKIEKRLLGIVA